MADAELHLLVGPTGAGKSALALALAERRGLTLVSADSRQIYRGFDIGTAKPSAAERARVPHEGVDVAEPHERWSAARWATEAEAWVTRAAAAGRPALVVGGTGLWMQALVRPLAAEPSMDPARLAAVRAELATLDTPALRASVEALDPPRAHLGRAQLLRAAEVALVSGTRLSDLHAAQGLQTPRAARWLVVDPGDALDARLDRRRAEMVDAGWVREVEHLVATIPEGAPAWNACGYREIRDAVRGARPLAEALALVRVRTRQYAKRQRTWFRNQLNDVGPVFRIDPTSADAFARADHWFTQGATS